MPEIAESGSMAIGLTVSLAPMTRVTSVSEKSSLISSISKTTALSVSEWIIRLGLLMTHYHMARMPLQAAHCIGRAFDQQQGE